MSDELHDQFESAASGASETVPQQCSALRKNGYVVLNNRACKIVDMSTSKTGKHGHAKVYHSMNYYELPYQAEPTVFSVFCMKS